ncbi:MAG: hypothetical protein IKZ87_01675 [Actinomycetaceae bacterium]|nr:hypothetical protein [Actinomycetaceae bacterium]
MPKDSISKNAIFYLSGTRGCTLAYQGRDVAYLRPADYTKGEKLVVFVDGMAMPQTRANEILLWGALCTKAGLHLLHEIERASFAEHPIERTEHEFVYHAASTIGWYLDNEEIKMQPSEVYDALEKLLGNIRIN